MAEPNAAQAFSATTAAMQGFPMLTGNGTDMLEWERRARARVELVLSIGGKLPETSIREIFEDGILKATKKDVTFWAKQFFRNNLQEKWPELAMKYVKTAVERYGVKNTRDQLYHDWKSLRQKGTLTEFAEEIVRLATALSIPVEVQ